MADEDEFERELTRALQAVHVPAGFADRVMQRVEPPAGRVLPWRHAPRRSQGLRLAFAACALLALGLAGEAAHRHRQSLEADRQFALAIQVTNQTLEQAAVETRMQLDRVSERFPNEMKPLDRR